MPVSVNISGRRAKHIESNTRNTEHGAYINRRISTARGYRVLKIIGTKRKSESENKNQRSYESSMRQSVRRCRADCRVQTGGDHVGGGSTRAWTVQPCRCSPAQEPLSFDNNEEKRRKGSRRRRGCGSFNPANSICPFPPVSPI